MALCEVGNDVFEDMFECALGTESGIGQCRKRNRGLEVGGYRMR